MHANRTRLGLKPLTTEAIKPVGIEGQSRGLIEPSETGIRWPRGHPVVQLWGVN